MESARRSAEHEYVYALSLGEFKEMERCSRKDLLVPPTDEKGVRTQTESPWPQRMFENSKVFKCFCFGGKNADALRQPDGIENIPYLL